jgi:hypothetical protein
MAKSGESRLRDRVNLERRERARARATVDETPGERGREQMILTPAV